MTNRIRHYIVLFVCAIYILAWCVAIASKPGLQDAAAGGAIVSSWVAMWLLNRVVTLAIEAVRGGDR